MGAVQVGADVEVGGGGQDFGAGAEAVRLAASGPENFAAVCSELGVRQSMGSVGTSADNAAAEAFNATLKRETLQGAKRWGSARQARQAVFKWITRYNTRRRHSSLNYLSPITYEQQTDRVLLAA
jgi:transposase InsO family protein